MGPGDEASASGPRVPDRYKDAIILNESSNFAADFKGSRTVTSKLQAPEHSEGTNIRYEKFGLSLFFRTAKLGKA